MARKIFKKIFISSLLSLITGCADGIRKDETEKKPSIQSERENTQQVLYSSLPDLFRDSREKRDYSDFLRKIKSIDEPSLETSIMTKLGYPVSEREMQSFYNNDLEAIVNENLKLGKLVHAAVFSSVLPGIPEEVIKSLWEKGMKFRSELIDVNTSKPEFKNIPYSKENLYLFGYELLRDYLRIAEVNSSSESYNPKIRERLVDLIKLYPGKVELTKIKKFVDSYGLNPKRKEIADEANLQTRFMEKGLETGEKKYFADLEELAAGYEILGKKEGLGDIFNKYFLKIVNNEIERFVGNNYPLKILKQRVEEFRPYLPKGVYEESIGAIESYEKKEK